MPMLRAHVKVTVPVLLSLLLLCGGAIVPKNPLPLMAAPNISAPKIAIPNEDNIDEEILYLNESGKICTLDTKVSTVQEITWCSPEDGIIDFAVGDFNRDGDDEVAAVVGEDIDGALIIYDPVVQSSAVSPTGWTNGVPWKKLATIPIGKTPLFVAVGELDVNVPGEEIVYGYKTGDAASAIAVLKADNPNPDGTSWIERLPDVAFNVLWSAIGVGNMDSQNEDEIVLVGEDAASFSRLNAYRIDNRGLVNKAPFFSKGSSSINWTAAAIGEVNGNSPGEIVAIRNSTDATIDNLFVFQFVYDKASDELIEDETASQSEFVAPDANTLFLANVTGIVNSSVDQEMFFLRSVPASDTAKKRLFMRNLGSDSPPDNLEEKLDSDNGWSAGTGGDVDGDAKDEIIIMRKNAIRVYNEPNVGTEFTTYAGMSTDGQHLLTANLDANGFRSALDLSATVSGLPNGLAVDQTGEFTIRIESEGKPVAYTAAQVEDATWVKSLSSVSGSTPAELTLAVDATGLSAGTYTVNIRITSNDVAVQNTPLTVPVTLAVLDDKLTINPTVANMSIFPCPTSPAAVIEELRIAGTSTISYTAFIEDSAAVAAAVASLSGPVTASQFTGDGSLELQDAAGNRSQLSVDRSALVAASTAQDSAAGPPIYSGVPWISGRSAKGRTNDVVTLTVLTTKLGEDEKQTASASLVILADDSLVEPPYNTYIVPIRFLCAASQIYQPVIYRQ